MNEEQYLTYVLQALYEEQASLNAAIEGKHTNIQQLQQYMNDYKAELDKFEVYDYEQTMRMLDQQGLQQVLRREEITKLIDSPYFGNFDFRYDGDDEAERFYIGRFGFRAPDDTTLIYDWRAPVCNMYYEFECGAAFYEAMEREFHGELTRKRQFKIEQSKLQYALDSSLTIQDEVLQQTLKAETSNKMKTIVTSIQREQNKIVRNVSANTLVIQGVAGSGKTAVALHRIAYFLYKFRDTLRPERIFILSPNQVFGDYISSVLPELGEQPIRSFTLDELTEQLLPASVSFTSFEAETKYMLQRPTSALTKRAAQKSDFAFLKTLQHFLAELDETMFTHEELTIAGVAFEPHYVQHRFLQYRSEPVETRLKLIVEDIIDVLKAKRDRGNIPSRTDILQRLKKRMRYTTPFSIYKQFLHTFDIPFLFKKKRFENNDVYPYLYVQHYMKGIKTYNMTQYFVLDEMQDYTPVQYAVLSKVFDCPRTIIGDFSQALLPYDTISKKAFEYLFRDLHYAELTTTYRSSYEIATYAKQFMRSGELHPIERHGKAPVERVYTSEAQMITFLKEALHSTHKTTAIICKTDAHVIQLHEALCDMPHTILDGTSKTFVHGVILTTIQYAKGLEFDAVIVPFVDATTYGSEFDRGLLYIAATRALHELTMLVSAKNCSPLLQLR
ncbi:HelD family protein [Caryophanon latum]|uniref:UvrD-like helicase ATP-binding domain-containing protein n=1 Tax=Caryophanon latum TaxID=33977 RepID=A0A1C0YPU9_9BACL|nr:ATP-binding domain-containing protein [Caryophanon latum]OCS89181.1 hypothetical protein A6K76_12555 [Caryophanon latum]